MTASEKRSHRQMGSESQTAPGGPLTTSEALNRPDLLADFFSGPSWATWKAVLRAYDALALDDDELALFHEVAGDRDPPTQPVKELACIIGRRGGKDSAASAIATIASLQDYSGRLRPGERPSVLCLAVDREQAKIVLNYIRGYFREVPLLRALVAQETETGVELINGVEIVIATNSYRSVRGRTIACAILDECAFWRSEESSNPDIEVFNSLLPGLVTLDGRIVLISSAYRKSGLIYQRWLKHYGKNSPDALVVRAPSRAFNPTIPAAVVNDALAQDAEAASAEWLSQWRSDVGDFVDRSTVEVAVDHGVNERPPTAGTMLDLWTWLAAQAVTPQPWPLHTRRMNGLCSTAFASAGRLSHPKQLFMSSRICSSRIR